MPEQLPEKLLAVLQLAQRFVASEIVPRNERLAHDETLAALGAEVREAAKAAGFFYKTQPAEFGGSPAGTWGFA